MTKLEQYYNKFHEEHRLSTRHGLVEFSTSMHFIKKFAEEMGMAGGKSALPGGVSLTDIGVGKTTSKGALEEATNALTGLAPAPLKIADIGAGTGRYSVELCHQGFDVTAVELVKHNLEILRGKHENIKTWQGDARNLHFLDDETFDITLLFGPMYHLHGDENKIKALSEATRITKSGGIILVAYVMNDYSVISYCFKEHKWAEVVAKGGLSEDFHTICGDDDLYDYVRLEDLDRLNGLCGLKRRTIFAPDGPADFMRRELNEMSDEEFSAFLNYQLKNCQRPELLGASSHLVDVLVKK